MPTSLPDSATLQVPPELSVELAEAISDLPDYDNREFYSDDVQTHVRDHVREAVPEGLAHLAAQIRQRLSQRPYCVLVQGLQFDEGNRLFVAINREFGTLVARPYEKPRAQLVHYIQPSIDLAATRGTRFESEKLHTDTADWSPPVELISMICVRADRRGGGRSQVLDVDTLREETLRHLGQDALTFLESNAVPWPLAPYLGGGVVERPVISAESVCWRRYSIDLALRSLGTELSQRMSSTLDAFEQLVADVPGTVEFLMAEGDLLFVDNWKTLHARTPLHDGPGSDRLMIRSWIRTSTGSGNGAPVNGAPVN